MRNRQALLRVSIAAALLLACCGVASACAVCFGDPDSEQGYGATMGILTMLGVTVAVLSCVACAGLKIALGVPSAIRDESELPDTEAEGAS